MILRLLRLTFGVSAVLFCSTSNMLAQVPFFTEPMISSGKTHTLALTTDGKVFAWGRNNRGQCGIVPKTGTGQADTREIEFATQVPFPTNVKIVQVAAGEAHSMALDSTGAVWVWGDNKLGQLGQREHDGELWSADIRADTGMFTSATPFVALHSFANETTEVTGSFPEGPGIAVVQNTTTIPTTFRYGVTREGGLINKGTVWFQDANGVAHTLADFKGPNGALPNPDIVEADGFIYGTTAAGGAQKVGALYRIKLFDALTSTAPEIEILHNFGLNKDGSQPVGGLLIHDHTNPNGGKVLYGCTNRGGVKNCGTAFRFRINDNAYSTLVSASASSQSPTSSLVSVFKKTADVEPGLRFAGLAGKNFYEVKVSDNALDAPSAVLFPLATLPSTPVGPPVASPYPDKDLPPDAPNSHRGATFYVPVSSGFLRVTEAWSVTAPLSLQPATVQVVSLPRLSPQGAIPQVTVPTTAQVSGRLAIYRPSNNEIHLIGNTRTNTTGASISAHAFVLKLNAPTAETTSWTLLDSRNITASKSASKGSLISGSAISTDETKLYFSVRGTEPKPENFDAIPAPILVLPHIYRIANGVQTLKKTRRPYQSRCSQGVGGEGFAIAGAALINPWLACRFMQVSVRLCLLPVLINFEKICDQYIFFFAPVFRFFCRC